ncbi:hypothetical protein HPP92_000516 [Vanilla planifolia]|uniref:HTH myb-type domain-containing protein n=1 Tax=Vanilla planifolia TaxID=51239 RepID=A0A835RWK0_VANPL|nr:hypothetical protein HPP92_000516 [Vanilla planifolia]
MDAELHRKFVQAVEQLGVEKAVPSRILELMGIHSLTRHNVASHLQKYRSQRKHLLAREAEAASWTQRRGVGGGGGGFTPRENNSSWLSPTMGFPPPLHAPYLRPLHVWGHPTVGRPTGFIGPWPSPAPHWPHQPPNYLNYWQTLYHGDLGQEWGPTAAVTALPLFPQPPAFVMRFASPTVSVVPPHAENFVPQWKQQSVAIQ